MLSLYISSVSYHRCTDGDSDILPPRRPATWLVLDSFSNEILPATILPGFGTILSTDWVVTDLPLPLSPTRPVVPDLFTENDTSSTAFTIPASVKKYVLRPSTSRLLIFDYS